MVMDVVADDLLWQPLASPAQRNASVSSAQHLFRVDEIRLKQLLSRAEYEGSPAASSEISLPVENGEIERFTLELSPIMEPELAAKYPDIQTYKVHGIDNPHASGRLSMTPKGFHGMITSPDGTFYIDPDGENNRYKSFKRADRSSTSFSCGVKAHNHDSPVGIRHRQTSLRTAGNLQVYRLALAATGEYVTAAGGTKLAAMSEITQAINRVNQIYERDLAIRLELVGNNNLLLYLDAAVDPYTNASNSFSLSDNQANIDKVIGSANYDIGHLFTTSGGGIAQVGSVCTSLKAQGLTGHGNPFTDAFYIDYVAHEIGHQFNAEHTFNATSGSCHGNRWGPSAFEPGSGSTIMAYAGICTGENIQSHSDAVFHAGSIAQIDGYTTTGNGYDCASILSVSNAAPTVDAGNDYVIPRKTPFMLSATAQDSDLSDTLSYSWDQMDAGSATTSASLGNDLTDNSLFRSYLPANENFRHFPALGTTLRNQYDDSEVLACKTRDLNFRVTVRDGKSGMAQDDVVVSVDNGSGPFKVTSFNSGQNLSPGLYVIEWDVANTNRSPVNCANVDISLLNFNVSRTRYSETLIAGGIANNGSHSISVPNLSNLRSRFKVQCSDNIFYDISDADLNLTGSTAVTAYDKEVFYNSAGLVLFNEPSEVCETEQPRSGGGSGAVNLLWLGLLLPLGLLRRRLVNF